MGKDSIKVGLVGLGTIGSGVAHILHIKSDLITSQLGVPMILARAVDLDESRRQSLPQPEVFSTNVADIINDPDIDILIELIGGENPARSFIEQALQHGKHVVTANKEVLSKHGPELLSMANDNNVSLLYEASVGGGIPLIAPLKRNLHLNAISAIHTIINGTTNYILTRMDREGIEFSEALQEAQSLGYAEADPTSDIEGYDAAYKIAILSSIVFRTDIRPSDVYKEGISRIGSRDFAYARELGYAIKLLAITKKEDTSIQARVHPVFLPTSMLLAKVDGVFNAVQIEGDLTGRVILYGRGAGSEPTANVVVSDAIHIALGIVRNNRINPELPLNESKVIKPIAEVLTRYYLRMTISDQAGVLSQITRILGNLAISISSAIQKETDSKSQTAEIVIMTHPAKEEAMQKAIKEMEQLESVKEISNLIRVEDFEE